MKSVMTMFWNGSPEEKELYDTVTVELKKAVIAQGGKFMLYDITTESSLWHNAKARECVGMAKGNIPTDAMSIVNVARKLEVCLDYKENKVKPIFERWTCS